MKKLVALLFAIAGSVAPFCVSDAQNTRGFQCLVSTPACSASLRANALTGLLVVSVAGYRSPGDSGGGGFYDLGAASSHCSSPVFTSGNWSLTPPLTTITGLSSTNYLAVGEALSGGGIQPGAEIASIVSPSEITMTLPAIANASGSLTISGDNTGTLIIDSEPSGGTNPGPQCWQKTNYRGEPHEWGAYGDGGPPNGHDDTAALQNWLGAYGNAVNTNPNTPASNFGPWIATIPATYEVSQPLVCPPYADLQAGANIAAGAPNNGGGTSSPIVKIVAVAPNSNTNIPAFGDTLGLSALMMASPYCRISGIALDANGNGNYIFPGLPGSVNNTTVTLNANAPAGIVPGMPLYDSGSCIAKGAAVTAVNGAILTMSVAASSGCGSGDSITITGFHGVDVG